MSQATAMLVLDRDEVRLGEETRMLTPWIGARARGLLDVPEEHLPRALEGLAALVEPEFATAAMRARTTWVPAGPLNVGSDRTISVAVRIVPDGCLVIGDVVLDPSRGKVTSGDRVLRLAPTPMCILGHIAVRHRLTVEMEEVAGQVGMSARFARPHVKAITDHLAAKLPGIAALRMPAPGSRVFEVANVPKPAPEGLDLSATYLRAGVLTHDLWRRQVTAGSAALNLSPGEQRLFRLHMLRPDVYIAREEVEAALGVDPMSTVYGLRVKVNQGPLKDVARIDVGDHRSLRLRLL